MAAPNGLARIETHEKKKHKNGVCHDDSAAPVRAQTIDELHSLQRKRSAPTTPIKDGAAASFAAALSEEERHRQQLQSIRRCNNMNLLVAARVQRFFLTAKGFLGTNHSSVTVIATCGLTLPLPVPSPDEKMWREPQDAP